ncbi:MAG: MATE family efflux transporter [Clostridia bacterium]|nr:MATE family efflux transporter [Clostridia bacterium]
MSKSQVSHTIDMCSGPMAGKIFQFVIPLMVSSILQLLFNAADIIVVSRFCGDEALAAVGSTSSLINLTVGLFIGMSTASNIIAARLMGERNFEKLHKVVHTSILVSVISGILLAAIGITFAEKALKLMGSPDDVIELSTLYLRIYFIGTPANLIYNFGSSLLRAKGDTKRPLYIITLAGVINFVLNLFFVAFCGRNVDGVAIATVVSQVVSAVLIIICLMSDNDHMRLNIKELKIHKKELLEILRIGLPAGIQGMVFSFSNITIQSAVNSFGKNTMAGYAAANSIQGFLYVAGNAFYQANMTFTSQNMGANQWDRMKRSMKLNILFEVIICTALGIIAFCFATPLLGIYTTDAAVVQEGITVMKYNCLLVVLCGLMETIMGGIRGMGYTIMTMVVSILGSCVLRIIWVASVFNIFPTTDVLFSIYPISWILTSFIHLMCYLVIFPRKKKLAELKNVDV